MTSCLTALAFVLLALAPRAAASANSSASCLGLVERYLERRSGALSAEQDPSKMLFFLHVPRTAGKTYYTCFLKSAYPPSQRCAKAYDGLRLNISLPGCQLLSSHDDLSVTDLFRPGGAVITQLRRPVDRVISAYEFAIDVAARHVHLSDADASFRNNTHAVSTLNVWPWSYLVPWFRRDMQSRMKALKEEAVQDKSGRPRWLSFKDPKNRTYYWSAETNRSVWVLPDPKPVLDPYNNRLVTPLHEWIELPVAQELVHNTATLQVLGLTNYSIWEEAAEARECVLDSPVAREALLGAALKRLVGMKHVGLTERLDQSVLSLAASLGMKMDGPAYKYTTPSAFSYDAPDLDEATTITYNSSLHLNNQTVSIHVARYRLVWLSERRLNVTEELRVLVPRLTQLLEKEEDWFDAQEAAAANGSAAAAAAGAEEATADGGEAASEEEGGDGAETAGLEDGAEKEETPKVNPSRPLTRRATQAEIKDVDKESKKKGKPPKHPDGGGSGSAAGERPEWQPLEHIDSPWAKEIEELDPYVAKLQREKDRIEWDMWTIQDAGGVRHSDKALGPAKQILPDEHFKQRSNLGASYKQCTQNTKRRHSASRQKVLKHVLTPWHESFAFSKEARKRIPQPVLERILELNAMDAQLYDLGDKLLAAKVAEQEAAGLLESLERPVPQHLRRKKAGAAGSGSGAAGAPRAGAAGDVDGGDDPEVEVDSYARDELRRRRR